MDVRNLRWKPWVLIGRRARAIPSDWVFFQGHDLIMPAHMVGKLTVDEWRPLMASSMIYDRRLHRSLWPKTTLLTLLPLLLLVLVFLVAIALELPIIALLYFVFIIPVTILGNRLYNPSLKKARLRADSEAAALVGKSQLLSVLRKVDGMGLPDVERMKSGVRVKGGAGFPNMNERIENLQGYSGAGPQ